jgi:hypothetical protein
MCSTAAQRIAEIGRAIDDLAAKARPAPQTGPAGQAGPAGGDTYWPADGGTDPARGGDGDPIVARLAELWALLAELDPEVGRRLAGYQNLPALNDLRPTPALWDTLVSLSTT